MINGKKVLAIIPARSGSKGLIGKNKKILCGKPLINWTIETALTNNTIDMVLVSTDDQELAEISRLAGAFVPFIRPNHLATDTATSVDVLSHAINFVRTDLGKIFHYVILLEPTSPIRDNSDIDSAFLQLVQNKNAKSIVGISRTESQHPSFLVNLSKSNFIEIFEKGSVMPKRRQEVSSLYFLEGSLYISEIDSLLSTLTFYHKYTLGYVIPKERAFEIDDEIDFIIVEALMKRRLGIS